MIGTTIIARSYRAQARVLESSFLEHHPGARFTALIIDGDETDLAAGASPAAILPEELGLPFGQWEQMAGVYTLAALANAIKPAFLLHLVDLDLARGGEGAVVYLDPDIKVYGPFPEIFNAAARSGIVLTPHVVEPIPRDGLLPQEKDVMEAGIFNLGFICVGPRALPFLHWWHERLRVDAVADLGNAPFTEQRWVDWAPAFWEAEILRDRGFNVAYWNIHERLLTRAEDGRILAGGDPLRFFHFSAYDPKFPWRLSRRTAANPRCFLGDNSVLVELCTDYSDALLAAGHAQDGSLSYGLDEAPNGLHLTPSVRAAYRAALRAALAEGATPPPSPFDEDGGDAFTRWLLTPVLGPTRLGLTRWHRQIWRDRPDLQAVFADPAGIDAFRYRAWHDTDTEAVRQYESICVPERFWPTVVREPTGADRSPGDAYKWNVVGYFAAELGVGEAARRMNLALETAGIATQVVSVGVTSSRSEHRTHFPVDDELRYENSLYCVNADQLIRTVAVTSSADAQAHLDRRSGRRIGLWFWEVSELPDYGAPTFSLLDEIWVASEFVAGAVSPASPIPVRVVPLPVTTPNLATPYRRDQLGLPEGFVFLFSWDFNSILERKNPLGLIDAFCRAFGPDDGARLVLKSINGRSHADDLARVRFSVRERPDILVMDRYVDAHETQALIELSDCLVSLHRAEGFGLNLAAAMAAARPVIATGYSGNMEFMDDDSAFLVPYELVPVGEGHDPYPSSAFWAEPDLDAAAAQMRRVFADQRMAAEVAARGRERVLRTHGVDVAAAEIGRLLGMPSVAIDAANANTS